MVGDVDSYPQFVPWLTTMRTWNAQEIAPGVTSVDAEAGVGISIFQEHFTTRVVRDANESRIEVALIRGPFRRLKNHWQFRRHPAGTQIEFFIDFEFRSRLLDAFLEANMDRAIAKLIACFEARAKVLYGERAAVESPAV